MLESGTEPTQADGKVEAAPQYDPDGHTTGKEAFTGQYIPAGQASAGTSPPTQNAPPPHGIHWDAFANEPAGQSKIQAAWSGDANKPGAHGKHADDELAPGSGLKAPGRH